MNIRFFILPAIASAVLFISGCQPSYSAEMSIPLGAADPQTRPVNPLDVQAAVEKIAADAGLVPYTAQAAEEDLMSIADDELLNSASAGTSARTWKHPQHPVFLSMTRQAGEIVLLLNCPPDANPLADAIKLYKSLQKQLSALPATLITPPAAQ
jgi:hypothetical protein